MASGGQQGQHQGQGKGKITERQVWCGGCMCAERET